MRARRQLHSVMVVAVLTAVPLLTARPVPAEEPEKAPPAAKPPCAPLPPLVPGCLTPGGQLLMPGLNTGSSMIPPLPPGGEGARPFGQLPEAGSAAEPTFAPNVLGDLLFGSRSVGFGYIRSSGNVLAGGSTSITNPSVAEDNSPAPRDRASFRYNFFDEAIPVQGFGPAVLGLPGAARGVLTNPPVTKYYDVNQYTFALEKTFLDGLMSVEVRVPFANTLSSHLSLSAGSISGTGSETVIFKGKSVTLPVFDVTDTPGSTLGSSRTELGNVSTIFKAKWYESSFLLASAGFSVGIPTAPDERVEVVDYGAAEFVNRATNQRVRDFDIHNSTWSMNPFVAVLARPTSRWFGQGFLQFDLPLNKSGFSYSEGLFLAPNRSVGHTGPPIDQTTGALLPINFVGNQSTPITVNGKIAEQTLMHVNLNTGYWLVQRPDAPWITGIAPSLELHYTTTLDNADVVQLPGDFGTVINPANPAGLQVPAPRPTIGNLRNRVDILDMTVGTTVLIGDRATLACGFAFPLMSNKTDRVFDWEGLVQFNYYFGARGLRGGPNVMGN